MKLYNIRPLNNGLILLVSLLLSSCLVTQETTGASSNNRAQIDAHEQQLLQLLLPMPQSNHFLLAENGNHLTKAETDDLIKKGIAAKLNGIHDITAMQQAIDYLMKAALPPHGTQAIVCHEYKGGLYEAKNIN